MHSHLEGGFKMKAQTAVLSLTHLVIPENNYHGAGENNQSASFIGYQRRP